METTATSKGQIVIPSSVRRRFGIKEGTRIRIEVDEGANVILLRPITRDYVHSLRGRFRGRTASSPCRIRIRSMVRSAGTTVTSGVGLRSNSIRIRRDPHRGCFRRISATATSTSVGAWCGHDAGRCDRSTRPVS